MLHVAAGRRISKTINSSDDFGRSRGHRDHANSAGRSWPLVVDWAAFAPWQIILCKKYFEGSMGGLGRQPSALEEFHSGHVVPQSLWPK